MLAAMGAGALLLPAVPRERAITLNLEEPSSVVGVDVAWSRDGAEPIRGGSWRFDPGAAPKAIETAVSLPDGTYDLDVTLRRTGGDDAVHRSIELADADRITVSVR